MSVYEQLVSSFIKGVGKTSASVMLLGILGGIWVGASQMYSSFSYSPFSSRISRATQTLEFDDTDEYNNQPNVYQTLFD